MEFRLNLILFQFFIVDHLKFAPSKYRLRDLFDTCVVTFAYSSLEKGKNSY